MKAFTKYLAGGLGLAALAAATPAAAQYGGYPGYPGGGYGYPGGGGNVVNDILGQILGGRSYANNERYAVEQCVRAVEYRINTRGLDNEGGRYQQYGYGYGYNNRYGNGYAGARVTSVTQVSRRSNGGLKVYGYATTSGGGYGGYGGGPGYGYGGPNPYGYGQQGYGGYGSGYSGGYQTGDAQFNCTIDRYGRITDIDARRNRSSYGYRGY
jgi:hypothetical protein